MIVTSIIEMAHKIGIQVVAEGVETKEQVDFLKRIKCDMAQGYIFARPMSILEYEKYVRK